MTNSTRKIIIYENELINLIKNELINSGFTKSVKLLIKNANDEKIRLISDVFDGHEITQKISLDEIFELIKQAYYNYDKEVLDIKYNNKNYGGIYEIEYVVKEMVYRK